MMRSLIIGSMLIVAAPEAIAQTPTVNAARSAGQVGERYDGYLGISGVTTNPVRSQVATINIQRRSLYSNLAASKHVSPRDVGITAGCQLLSRVSVGERYMLSDGVWRQRRPGAAAPQPAYCR